MLAPETGDHVAVKESEETTETSEGVSGGGRVTVTVRTQVAFGETPLAAVQVKVNVPAALGVKTR